jgi:capsular polysaccharide biosynthesis protein
MLAILGLLEKIRIEQKEPIVYSKITIPSYCASGDGYIPIDLVQFLQRSLSINIPGSKEKSKIYVSRKNAGWRRVINEEYLEPILKKANFKILCNETMSVGDQIQAFSNASVVIAPHGAGLTNIIYSHKRGEKVCVCEVLRE